MVTSTGGNQTNRVQLLGVPLTSSVTFGKAHKLPMSQFLRDKMGLTTEPSGVVEIQGAETCRASRKRLV